MTEQIVVWLVSAVLAVSAMLSLWRMVRGPSIVDRAVANEVLMGVMICALGVEAAVLEPTQWGGWGYRIMPGRSAIILRRGPGMVITQRNEKQFAISLDRPEEPASILLGLIAPSVPSAEARS